MTKKEMLEALEGLPDDAKITMEVNFEIFGVGDSRTIEDVVLKDVYEDEPTVYLEGTLK